MAPVQGDDRLYRVAAAIERATGSNRLLDEITNL
jgi:hypothetical protein